MFNELTKISQKQDLLKEDLNAFKANVDKKFDTVFVCLRIIIDKLEIHVTDDEVWCNILSIICLY